MVIYLINLLYVWSIKWQNSERQIPQSTSKSACFCQTNQIIWREEPPRQLMITSQSVVKTDTWTTCLLVLRHRPKSNNIVRGRNRAPDTTGWLRKSNWNMKAHSRSEIEAFRLPAWAGHDSSCSCNSSQLVQTRLNGNCNSNSNGKQHYVTWQSTPALSVIRAKHISLQGQTNRDNTRDRNVCWEEGGGGQFNIYNFNS